MAGLRRNLEIKARCAGLAAAGAAIQRFGVPLAGREIQVDTYFHVVNGRLKLRVIEGQPAVLIWYDRPNNRQTRASAYYLVPVPDLAGMKAALTAALGVRGEVCKHRDIYLWHNVRIHLDQVAGLGAFVEFEAVLSEGETEAASRNRLDRLSQVLGLISDDVIGPSYADLLGF